MFVIHTVKNNVIIEKIGNALNRQFPKEFDFEGESHEFVEIVYIESGKVSITENEKVYVLGSGDLIIHAPMEFHRITSEANTVPHVYNLSVMFNGEIPQKLYSGVFSLSPEQRSEFLKIISLVNEFEKTNKETYLQQASHEFYAFLLDLYHNNDVNSATASGSAVVAYKKIVMCMNREIYSNLTLNEIALKNNISISYIKLLFRTYANICPKKYYSQLRANEAAKMLAKGMSVTEISEKMNFSSPNYFSVYFKKYFGTTPVEYKKINNQ